MRSADHAHNKRPSTVNFLMEPPRKAGSIISIRTASFENRCRSSAPSELAPHLALRPIHVGTGPGPSSLLGLRNQLSSE